MKLLFDLFPVLLFFLAYKLTGEEIYVATAVAIGATFAQVAYCFLRKKPISPTLWLSFGIVTIFGGATLILHNKTFILWKPTVLYWTLATALLIARYGFRKNGLKSLLGSQLNLPAKIWDRLNIAWASFFTTVGGINLFVAFNFSEHVWVNFKTFGLIGLVFVFSIAQALAISKYIEPDTPKE
ncbi:septation protein A [Parachitinimonas caeni]|uniref:Inner membrane-spanning protein YciB n=1 Tax=Parachitinimonas caeni TaxID=3031301 RepID=A0ABT7DUP1_9NEIS|nr:septation protein A [Parachitinimonas caeni]MDK2123778.1 septation protein A [Parachitinimonas caeni]